MGHHKKEKKSFSSSKKDKKKSKKSGREKKKIKDHKINGNDGEASEIGESSKTNGRPTSDEILESLINDVKNSSTPVDLTTMISKEKENFAAVDENAKTKKDEDGKLKKKKKRSKSRKRSRDKSLPNNAAKKKKIGRSRSRSASTRRSRSRSRSKRRSRSYSSRSRSRSHRRSSTRSSSRSWSRQSRSRSYSSRSRSYSHSRSRSYSSRSRSRTWSRSPRSYHHRVVGRPYRHFRGGSCFGGRFGNHGGYRGRRFSPHFRSHNHQHRGGPMRWRFNEKDYTNADGEIDKQKLLEIATKNATKLALEGKLPKGVELLDTMKNKSINELVSICKQLHKEEDLMEKVSSDEDDYDHRYERWRRLKAVEPEENEFVPRPVRSAGEIKINLSKAESKENGSKLTTAFPVSSGAQHRVKADLAPAITMKLGESAVGPLTAALGKIKTNIPFAYKPPPQPPTDVFAALSNASTAGMSLGAKFDAVGMSTASSSTALSFCMPPPPQPPDVANMTSDMAPETAGVKLVDEPSGNASLLSSTSETVFPSASTDRSVTNNNGDDTKAPLSNGDEVLLPSGKLMSLTLPPPPEPPVLASFDSPARSAELLAAVKRKAAKANARVISEMVPLPPLANDPMLSQAAPAYANADSAMRQPSNMIMTASWPPSTLFDAATASAAAATAAWPVSTRQFPAGADALPFTLTPLVGEALNDRAAALVSKYSKAQITASLPSSLANMNGGDVGAYNMLQPDSSAGFSLSTAWKPKTTTRSVQELVAERLKYSNRLKEDPNDYRARKRIAEIDEEMSEWAKMKTETGKFSGSTGARVLTAEELAPSNPRFNAWAKKDLFKSASEVSGGVGMRLLQKMGWTPGSGLGKNGAGQLEPLTLDVKADRRGLQSLEDRKVTKRETVSDVAGKNPVSLVMEYCSKNRLSPPDFSCEEFTEMGTNKKSFLWKAVLNEVEYQPSLPSSNKKVGKAQVCLVMVEALGLITMT